MMDRFQLAVAKCEIRAAIRKGEHYLATGLLLGVIPSDDDIEKAAMDLLNARAAARQKGKVYERQVEGKHEAFTGSSTLALPGRDF